MGGGGVGVRGVLLRGGQRSPERLHPYMQYFTGEKVFQKRPPMNPIDMTKFRKRIGEKGVEKIFKISLMVNASEITEKELKQVMIDSTVQEKNITFPTDAKLYRKKFCKRAGIEPVIGHLKYDHRMMWNYLKGTLGDAINTMMAAAAYNMRHWMNKHALSSFVSWLLTLVRRLENVLFENENQYAWKDSTLAMVAE